MTIDNQLGFGVNNSRKILPSVDKSDYSEISLEEEIEYEYEERPKYDTSLPRAITQKVKIILKGFPRSKKSEPYLFWVFLNISGFKDNWSANDIELLRQLTTVNRIRRKFFAISRSSTNDKLRADVIKILKGSNGARNSYGWLIRIWLTNRGFTNNNNKSDLELLSKIPSLVRVCEFVQNRDGLFSSTERTKRNRDQNEKVMRQFSSEIE